jgi:RNA polymerase primary sigma factor
MAHQSHGDSGSNGDALQSYLRRIARIPLLTPAEEVHLGALVRDWREAPSPTAGQLRSGRRALDRMVRANLRLVVSVCRHQLREASGMELMDLIQAGNLGLIRAVELFDPRRGYRFSTYAYWWIRQGVRRAQMEQGQLLYVPLGIRKLAAEAQALSQTSPAISLPSMAQRLGVQPARLAKALEHNQAGRVLSLDQSFSNLDEGGLLDRLSGGDEPQPLDDYTWLHINLAQLNDRARRVLALRYGGPDVISLSQVAERMGLTKSTVQGVEERALRQLRGALDPRRDRGLRPALSA